MAVGCSEAKIISPLDQSFGGDRLLWNQLEIDDSFVADFKGPKVFDDEINHGILVPRRIERATDRHGFVSILCHHEVSRSVVREPSGDGGDSDFPLIDIDGRSRLIGTDRHATSHTAHRREQVEGNKQ